VDETRDALRGHGPPRARPTRVDDAHAVSLVADTDGETESVPIAESPRQPRFVRRQRPGPSSSPHLSVGGPDVGGGRASRKTRGLRAATFGHLHVAAPGRPGGCPTRNRRLRKTPDANVESVECPLAKEGKKGESRRTLTPSPLRALRAQYAAPPDQTRPLTISAGPVTLASVTETCVAVVTEFGPPTKGP